MTNTQDALLFANSRNTDSFEGLYEWSSDAEHLIRKIVEENQHLKDQLRCNADNLEKGMSKSIQKLCAKSIRETLKGNYQ